MGAIMCGGGNDAIAGRYTPHSHHDLSHHHHHHQQYHNHHNQHQPHSSRPPSTVHTPNRTPRKSAIKQPIIVSSSGDKPASGRRTAAAGRSSDWRSKPVRHISFFDEPAPTTRQQLLGSDAPDEKKLIQPNTKLIVSEQAELCLIEGAEAIVEYLAQIYDSWNSAANKINLAPLLVFICTLEVDVAQSSPLLLDSDYSTSLLHQLDRISRKLKDIPSIDSIEEDQKEREEPSFEQEILTISMIKATAEERIQQRQAAMQKVGEEANSQAAVAAAASVEAADAIPPTETHPPDVPILDTTKPHLSVDPSPPSQPATAQSSPRPVIVPDSGEKKDLLLLRGICSSTCDTSSETSQVESLAQEKDKGSPEHSPQAASGPAL